MLLILICVFRQFSLVQFQLDVSISKPSNGRLEHNLWNIWFQVIFGTYPSVRWFDSGLLVKMAKQVEEMRFSSNFYEYQVDAILQAISYEPGRKKKLFLRTCAEKAAQWKRLLAILRPQNFTVTLTLRLNQARALIRYQTLIQTDEGNVACDIIELVTIHYIVASKEQIYLHLQCFLISFLSIHKASMFGPVSIKSLFNLSL